MLVVKNSAGLIVGSLNDDGSFRMDAEWVPKVATNTILEPKKENEADVTINSGDSEPSIRSTAC